MHTHYKLNMDAPLTFWDYTHADIKDLVRHPDYSIERLGRIAAALGEAEKLIQAAVEREMI